MSVFAFYLFAISAITGGLFTVISRQPVHSVLWLILTFFTAAGLFVLIGAEFLAMLLVVVYVGAVAVLFLFVVMMLDVDFVELKQGTLRYWPFAVLIGLAFIAEIALASFARGGSAGASFDASPGADTNAEAIGQVMYTDYFLLFQMAGLVLLVAMIGAIVLTLRERPGIKRQNIARQTSRRREDATEKVAVEPGRGI